MDEKGLKKILQVIDTCNKLKAEGKLTNQGFNDRIGVAKEIYDRNKSDKWFVSTLEKSIQLDRLEIYKLIKS